MSKIPTDTAIFAAGCFWGVEYMFKKVAGVIDVVSGYTGGFVENPTYEQVCSGKTGHAESVLIVYDPDIVSYESLVRYFLKFMTLAKKMVRGQTLESNIEAKYFT